MQRHHANSNIMDIFEEVLRHLFQHLSDKTQDSRKKNRVTDEFHRLISIIEIFFPYAVGIRFKGSVYCIIIDIVNKDKTSSPLREVSSLRASSNHIPAALAL